MHLPARKTCLQMPAGSASPEKPTKHKADIFVLCVLQ